MSERGYSYKNVLCCTMLVFVISFIIGGVTGWIACHNYEMNQEKMEIREHMSYHKSSQDYIKNVEKMKEHSAKSSRAIKAEGSMHSQAPNSGSNSIERMHYQNGEDPDRMMVERMEPADLTIAQDRNIDGQNTPYDRRHIDAIADDPDEKLMRSFESPFSSWRNNMIVAEGANFR